ncbi:hypothetical protein E4U55_008095, partial [Claviceps digitariae]
DIIIGSKTPGSGWPHAAALTQQNSTLQDHHDWPRAVMMDLVPDPAPASCHHLFVRDFGHADFVVATGVGLLEDTHTDHGNPIDGSVILGRYGMWSSAALGGEDGEFDFPLNLTTRQPHDPTASCPASGRQSRASVGATMATSSDAQHIDDCTLYDLASLVVAGALVAGPRTMSVNSQPHGASGQ